MTGQLSALLILSLSQVQSYTPNTKQLAAINEINASGLQANVEFLASDLLEGRNTPSKGLDIAAEYIASQFKKAGLEPGGDRGFFQVAGWRGDAAVSVRNVVGLLRGSDPKLRETYVIVSAHYDHLGVRENLEGDKIFNGANDDASGVSGVIEVAQALGKLQPKRSVVFIALYGEEKGLVGSRFYVSNPRFPLKSTVAAINLEQIGRTDDLEGPRVSEASMTGFDYTDLGALFNASGKPFGVKVTRHPRNSDAFFARSDNQAFADIGIPSGTLCTAYIYPDYHKASDHFDKLDYSNMAKIVRMVAAGVLAIAESAHIPRWNAQNPKSSKYVEAWKLLVGG